MNSWSQEQEAYMAMQAGGMPTNQIPGSDGIGSGDGANWSFNPGSNVGDEQGENFIGPIPPENEDTTMDLTQDESSDQGNVSRQSKHGGSHGKESRWSKNRDRDSSRDNRGSDRRRLRSPDRNSRDRNDRNDRSRSGRENRDRPSRFSHNQREKPSLLGTPNMGLGLGSNMIMQGMMPYGAGNNMMGQSPMDMPNMPPPMQNMPNIPNMPMQNMPNMMPGMNIHPSMMGNMMPNMMPNMMDPSMMMAQQQMQMMAAQPIYVTGGVLLIPLPGVSVPPRRERPVGCRTIFVGGLPPGIGEDSINEMFQRFGEIESVKIHKQGVCHIRFMKQETVEASFALSGCRFKTHEQTDNEATTLFIDYALSREDQSEGEKQKREPTPPRIEPFTAAALNALTEKIKSDTDFAESAPTLAGWLERGECNKKNANTFYSLIQASNNQMRRLYNEKIGVDEEFLNMKSKMKEKFAHIILQFEQVAKILSAAKHKRTSDHFSKQQRRNIEMWLKMTEDLENIKEEFNMLFDDDDSEKIGQKLVSADKYEQLKMENDTLIHEVEGYKNEAHLAKDEAERKFEKFKAHFIAQQALHSGRPNQAIFPPLPPPATTPMPPTDLIKSAPPTPDEMKYLAPLKQEAKFVSMLTAFLLAHPLGATIDYLASYVKSMVPNATQAAVNQVLTKYGDIFARHKDRWIYILFDKLKQEH